MGEYNDEASLTIPNQALSIDTIIKMFTRGEPVEAGKSVYYDNIDDFDQFDQTLDKNFDLSDYSEMKRLLKDEEQRRSESKEIEDGEAESSGSEAGTN